ncbi:MAG: hypothetical protein R6V86_12830 [Spirochaetia bacterium]
MYMKNWRLRTISGLFTLYLFLCTVVVGMLFVVGNNQVFLESTNKFLLYLLEWILFCFLIADVYYTAFFVIEKVKKNVSERRHVPWGGLVWSGIGFLYGSSFLLFLNFVLSWL